MLAKLDMEAIHSSDQYCGEAADIKVTIVIQFINNEIYSEQYWHYFYNLT